MNQSIELDVQGMTCDSCSRHVSHALEAVGAENVDVSWRNGRATFELPTDADEATMRASIEDAGYRPGDLRVVGGTATAEPSGSNIDGPVDYDLVAIGAGSAAFAAAIRATEAGHSVAIVEDGPIGGTCVNVGCVPSKALLRAGELRAAASTNPFHGVQVSSNGVDLAALVSQKDELVQRMQQVKYLELVEAYGFEVIEGRARFVDAQTIEVGNRRITASAFLVSTGASPWVPPIEGLEEAGYLTSTTALELETVPERLAVIGANAIGLELGQFFAHVGSEVTWLDVADRIAPFEEPEISAALTEALTDEGARILTDASIEHVTFEDGVRTISATVDGERVTIDADQILVATGRRPNTDGLGLDAAGIETDPREGIVVDEQLRTSNPRVWAAGDVVAGTPQFVYVAAKQGSLAAGNALEGAGETVDETGMPRVTFTAPQVASAGWTEHQARERGFNVKTSTLNLEHVPRALVNRDTLGLIKLVADADTDRLLGASILAESAGEVVQTAVLAIRQGMTTAELAATFHPYLTMVEGLKLAAQAFDRDVAMLSCCAA